ncbi:hypothetical protein GQ54DRAFT_311453 [Martensiomyces pterosporus]|nr:hypothetical protein GQ54DRAFT_311453 [Martensiomyces pterosporus]
MNFNQALSELEDACADFQVPATRFAAEQRLQEFGKRPDAIAAGKYILANSNLPTAQFFAVRGIKDAVIDSYAVLGIADALALRDELFQMATSNSRSLESFVLDSLCWVIAVITKRAWVESTEDQRTAFTKALYADVIQHSTPSIGIITTTYLIDEIAGGSKCSEFHLPWEFHYSCKASFENTHMLHLFEASLKVLHSQLQRSIETPSTDRQLSITFERRSALHIVEKVLSWEFTSPDANKVISASFGYSRSAAKERSFGGSGRKSRSAGIGGDNDDDESGQMFLEGEDQSRTPVFPSAWQSLLLNSDVISLFFSVYEATFKDQMHAHFSPGSTHIALQCIIQISGLRGKDLFGTSESRDGDAARTEYARAIMRSQLQMIRHVCSMNLKSDGVEDNVMATTQMIRRFIETQLDEQPSTVVSGQRLHPLALLVIGAPEAIEYFDEVSKFICTLLQAASDILNSDAVHQIDEDFGDVDNYFVMQAFDELANAWSAVINEIHEWEELGGAAPTNPQQDAATGPSNSSDLSSTNGQIDNRSALSTFLQFLASTALMIRSGYARLRMLMCEVAARSGAGDSEGSIMDQGLLEKDYVVYEDQLQFYAMLARLDMATSMDKIHEGLRSRYSALRDEFKRMESQINSGIYSESSTNQQAIDLFHEQIHWIVLMLGYTLADSGTSERVLIPRPAVRYSASCASPEQDYIVQSIMLIFEILEFELMSPSAALASYCSPLLVETLFWALRRVAPVYLLIDQSDYREVSNNIVAAFGRSADGGNSVAIIQGLLGLVRRNFGLWSSEEDVLHMCVDMLLAFAQRSNIAQEITQAPQFTPLVLYFTSNLHMFPESTHSSIVEALALLSCHSVSDEHERSFSELKTLILISLNQVVQDASSKAQYQDFRVIAKILDGLDMMDGILSAASFQNMDMIFGLFFEVQPIFERLLSVYAGEHSVLLKIIQVAESAAKYLDVSSLPDDEHKLAFSRNIRAILLKYQSANDGLTTYEVGADVESMLEVTALMSVVSNLVRNEIGFAPNEANRSISKQVSDDFGETEVFGLYCIHTTTTPSQILAPNVMRSYMHLLSELVQYRTPSLIRWLPAESWKAVLNMLIEGIDHDVYDVGRRTYESISKLGALIKLGGLEGASSGLQELFHEGIKRILTKLLHALLFSPFDAGLVEPAGAAMVTLGLIEPAHLQLCFNELFAQGESAAFMERLSATFAKFNADLESSEAVRKLVSSNEPIPDPIDSSELRQPLFEFLVNTRAVLRVR